MDAGERLACGVTAEGGLACWGASDHLELTDDDDWADVEVGDGWLCARTDASITRCWGRPSPEIGLSDLDVRGPVAAV